jgi:lysophospholipase L1-like esterase
MGRLINPNDFVAGHKITALGDSISAFAQFQQLPLPATLSLQAWAPSAAYVVGNCRLNNGFIYKCTTAGTSASSGGPTGNGSTDGTAVWSFVGPAAVKTGWSYLTWAEIYSQGRLTWDQQTGRNGVFPGMVKVYVIAGGTGYSQSDTVTFTQGGAGTLVVNQAGQVTGVTVTDPGVGTGSMTYTINTSTGSGAILSIAAGGTGTFGTPGCKIQDAVASLPDVIASGNDICVVLIGTNDLPAGTTYAAMIAGLRTIYETLTSAGIRVVAVPILPRTASMTPAMSNLRMRVNNWMRGYVRQWASNNPLNNRSIVLADPSKYMVDGTNVTFATGGEYPVGGATAASGSVLQGDGLHPSSRGFQAIGYTIWQALQNFVVQTLPAPDRSYGIFDGYDPTYNPNGNMIEGTAWAPSTAYGPGSLISTSGGFVYYYVGASAGISASSGSGPTTNAAGLTDGTCTWTAIRRYGVSVANGAGGTLTTAGSVTCSGTLSNGLTLTRAVGSAAGTIVGAIENPWSDSTFGARNTLTFSIGSGTVTELWQLTTVAQLWAGFGVIAADLANSYVYPEIELELSGVANMTVCDLKVIDATSGFVMTIGCDQSGAVNRMANSASDVIPVPQRIVLRGSPLLLPAAAAIPVALTNLQFQVNMGFDASGGAGSATAVVKINHIGLRKAYVS